MMEEKQEEDYMLYGVGDQHHIFEVLVMARGKLHSNCLVYIQPM